MKNVPKNLLPPGTSQEDEEDDVDEGEETLTTLGDVTSDAPPRKFANNIFEKLTDEPFDGVTPAPIQKSKTKKGPRKPKGSTTSVESGENFSVEQSGATTSGIVSSNEEITSGKELLSSGIRQDAKSSSELDRQGKNLIGRIVNDEAVVPTNDVGAQQGAYQQPQTNTNFNTDVLQNQPPRPLAGNEAQEQTYTNPGFLPTGQNPSGQLNPATNYGVQSSINQGQPGIQSFTTQDQSGVQSFTNQAESYQGGNQLVDFQPQKPSSNPFINNAGPQSSYQQGQIVSLDQLNPSNDPLQFTASPGGYQVPLST